MLHHQVAQIATVHYQQHRRHKPLHRSCNNWTGPKAKCRVAIGNSKDKLQAQTQVPFHFMDGNTGKHHGKIWETVATLWSFGHFFELHLACFECRMIPTAQLRLRLPNGIHVQPSNRNTPSHPCFQILVKFDLFITKNKKNRASINSNAKGVVCELGPVIFWDAKKVVKRLESIVAGKQHAMTME